MNEIEKKAHALANEVAAERGETPYYKIFRNEFNIAEALCRAIEQHEAYKQEVSDAVEAYLRINSFDNKQRLVSFIIPKPTVDPLEDLLYGMWISDPKEGAKAIHEALAKRGFKIVETFTRSGDM